MSPPDDENPNPGASTSAPANSAAAPAAGSASAQSPASALPGAPNPSDQPAAAASSSERPAAYEGSEPSLLQTTAAKEPPKADAKPADAAVADGTKPAESKPDTKAAEKPAEGDAKKPDAAAAKPGEEKPVEAAAKPTEAEKPATVEYKYALPETIKLDDAHKTELHGLLDAFRADPANVQPLIDYHHTRLVDYAKEVDANNRRVFNEMRAENRKAIMADPQLGGSGHQTTAQAVARMRDLLIPKEMLEPRKFDDGKPRLSIADEFLELTGAGDHPVLWHMLHNAARYLDEPQAKDLPPNVRPPKDIGRRPKGRLRDMYDHPRSNGQT